MIIDCHSHAEYLGYTVDKAITDNAMELKASGRSFIYSQHYIKLGNAKKYQL